MFILTLKTPVCSFPTIQKTRWCNLPIAAPQLPPIFKEAWLNSQDPTLPILSLFLSLSEQKTHLTCENVQEKKERKSDRSSVNRDDDEVQGNRKKIKNKTFIIADHPKR